MKIKLYRSSTLGIIFDNFKILTDPWLVDGEYYGSWHHYPNFNLDEKLSEINSYDAIYISHIHPDHCSEKTLSRLRKDIPIYIHSYHSKFLKRKINNLGFRVIELENNKRFCLTDKIGINIIAADDCNPQLCYKFIGCADLNANGGSQQIDSVCIVDDGKDVVLNLNDSPYQLACKLAKKIKTQYEKISILLTGYAGAGPYPQCFENLDKVSMENESKKKKKYFLNQALNFIKLFNPDHYMPFAGTYLLGGDLANLNSYRGVPLLADAYEFLEKKIHQEKLTNKSMNLYYDNIFDLDKKKVINQSNQHELLDYKKYISNVLSKKKMDYQDAFETSSEEIIDLLDKAKNKYFERIENFKVRFNTKLIIQIDQEKLYFIDSQKQNSKIIDKSQLKNLENFVKINTDKNLLTNILKGPKYAHWNNAEVGSHLKFFRFPDNYERGFYYSLSFLHC